MNNLIQVDMTAFNDRCGIFIFNHPIIYCLHHIKGEQLSVLFVVLDLLCLHPWTTCVTMRLYVAFAWCHGSWLYWENKQIWIINTCTYIYDQYTTNIFIIMFHYQNHNYQWIYGMNDEHTSQKFWRSK